MIGSVTKNGGRREMETNDRVCDQNGGRLAMSLVSLTPWDLVQVKVSNENSVHMRVRQRNGNL